MAGTTLLALIDDIASVLGDDRALNAQEVSGVQAHRERSVVWAVAKGSLLNKAILAPAALLISWLAPWLITPLLMVGGLYLCFEGFEKVAHPCLHPKRRDRGRAPANPARRIAMPAADCGRSGAGSDPGAGWLLDGLKIADNSISIQPERPTAATRLQFVHGSGQVAQGVLRQCK